MKKNQKIIISIIAVIVLVIALFLIFKSDKSELKIDNIIKNENIVDNDDENSGLKEFDKEKYDQLMLSASNAYNQQKYGESIKYLKQALELEELDVVYAKMYSSYKAMGDSDNAFIVLEKARGLNNSFNQYWIWTIEHRRIVDNYSFDQLDEIYKEGIDKVELTAKVNFVIFFASTAEQMSEKERAIELWEHAIELYPDNKNIYQNQIDTLKNTL